MMTKPALHPLILTLSLLISGMAHAQNFSQTVVFGDSLSDAGRLKGMVTDINPTVGNQLQPSFTTNPDPVWAEILAHAYGNTAKPNTTNNQTGTNYAVGGSQSARTAQWTDASGQMSIDIPTTKTQINEYFQQTGGQANPQALYAVWIGANDLFHAIESTQPSHIGNAVEAAAKDIQTLGQKGAKVILVPSIPDLSLTPLVQQHPLLSAKKEQIQLLTKMYNHGLFKALNDGTANVIPANTFALLQEAHGNLTAFKLSNAKDAACHNHPQIKPTSSSIACDEHSLVAPNANDSYMFADLIHPSGHTHRILAQYYRSLIDSPTHMAGVMKELAQVGTTNHQNLYRKLNSLSPSSHSIWLDANTSFGKTHHPNLMVGFDVSKQHSHTGMYVNHQTQAHSPNSTINADSKQIGMGLYHQHRFGNVLMNADIGVDKITLDTHRHVDWEGASRIHHGKADGRRHHAGLQIGHESSIDELLIRPYIGMYVQKVHINSFTESDANLSTALQYTLPTQKSYQGSIGVDMEYPINTAIKIRAGIEHSHDFNDDGMMVGAKLPSVNSHHHSYLLPVHHQKEDNTQAHLGIQGDIGRTSLNAGLTAIRQNHDTNIGGQLGLQFKF
ncbi:SGNH/GDSL hydrolase family protein [Moraxella sp. Tifton1]|uniref:autotransporter domain-containing protein n=1 Tax=Moraxella oculi TaxID=2940516 RepID=UPI002011A668|nr:autotransporter domain-containing protein [Moraxella sp. Tifton1]MCL1622970.1 SGNH/GDSL hydrolase family protein [Moraxella sp. Tifton1]